MSALARDGTRIGPAGVAGERDDAMSRLRAAPARGTSPALGGSGHPARVTFQRYAMFEVCSRRPPQRPPGIPRSTREFQQWRTRRLMLFVRRTV